MNKTIIININSIVFHIEEDAYENLRGYMIEIKRHFSQSEDSGEILLDIENRVAEMFSERIQQGKKEVISAQDVQEVIAQMGRVSDFEEAEEMADETFYQEKKEDSSRISYEKKLMRSSDDVVIGGVCSGLGYFFGIQTKWVRVLFVLFFLFGGSGVLLYVVLWIVMPVATSRADKMAMRGEEVNLQNFKKNYEEEFKEGFSNVQGQLSKGAQSLGASFGSFFRFVGRGFAFIFLIVSGMTIIGMLITLVGFSTAIFGLQNDMAFPGLDVLPQSQALIALVAGVLAIMIPFVALFHLLVRVLFNTRPMNNYFSLSLWGGWIASIAIVVFFTFLGAQEFKEESTIKIDKPLVKQDVYYFSEKDTRVIEASTLGNGKKKYKIEVEGEELSAYLKNDIGIRFEYLNEGEEPFIQYNYYAKGKSYQAATKRASDIEYVALEEKGKVVFNSHFSLGRNNEYRDQSVDVVVYLPIGSKVVIDESLRYKIRRLNFGECKNEYSEENIKSTDWVMNRGGLTCVPNFDVVSQYIEDAPEDDVANDIVAKGKDIERAAQDLSKKIELEAAKIEEKAKKLENTVTNQK